MPTIYLSPSTQEFNPYVDYGNEEYYMNLIADAMIPYLEASGIDYIRNTPDMNAASSIRESNEGNYDLHLALHSNASGEANAGAVRGTEVYYYPFSSNSQRAAEIIANNLKLIYPLPENVSAIPTTSLGEVARTKAPAVLIEYAYHDNPQDAQWIRNNIDAIAQNTVLSLTDYFSIPFNFPQPQGTATVRTREGSNLNIRKYPSFDATVIGSAPDKATVTVLSRLPDWYLIRYGDTTGYSYSPFLVE
ncbi:MAG: N-acetylmuramoyl-L-alanine amidase [Acutalibacteraceae bacterium]|nr:N-acetylmuramoyl-L-alanine amidase [Acutalibacteraceae bacterium]